MVCAFCFLNIKEQRQELSAEIYNNTFAQYNILNCLHNPLFCPNSMISITEFRKRYHYDPIYDKIGEGGFAKVYKARDNYYQRDVALKFYYGSLGDRYSVQAEVEKMLKIQHHNLIQFYGVETLLAPEEDLKAPDGKVQVGIMEYVNGGDFDDFMASFPSQEAIKKALTEILQALAYLHDRGIIHRDIKPQNILMHRQNNQWIVKIGDFGLARQAADSRLSSKLLGTVEYIAPEQLDPTQFGKNGKLSTNVDLWGFGVIVAEVFTGESPFGNRNEGNTHEQVMFNILKKDISEHIAQVSAPYKDMIAWCLRKHAEDRVQTAHQLLQLLEGKTTITPAKVRSTAVPIIEMPLSQTQKITIFAICTLASPLVGLVYYLLTKNRQPQNAKQVLQLLPFAGIAWLLLWLLLSWLFM